jgi:hypothetical protein
MKIFIIAVLLLVYSPFWSQTYSDSPVYSFRIRQKVEPPILSIEEGSLRFVDANGNNAIDALEECAIQFRLRNTGKGDGINLKATLTTASKASGVSYPATQALEILKAGASNNYSLRVNSDINTTDGMLRLKLEVEEPNGFNADPVELEISTLAFLSPNVSIVDHRIFGSDGSSTLQLKRPIRLQLLVQNTGAGTAENVNFALNLPDNVLPSDGDPVQSLGILKPGETKSVEIEFFINAKYSQQDLPLTAQLTEKHGKYSRNWNQKFQINQQISAERLIVQSKTTEKTNVTIASLRSDVDKDIPQGLPEYPKRYAICIGNENYSAHAQGLTTEVDVPFAINDATVFAEYANSVLGVPKANVLLLVDATKARMSQELHKIEKWMELDKGESEVIFYYSGHGLPEEATNIPFLIPIDVDGTRPTDGLALNEVYNRLSSNPSRKVTVILDACFSGGARAGELVAMKGIKVKQRVEGIPANLVVLASSSGNEASAVYKEKQHGYFTYYLLKWLKENRGQGSIEEMMAVVRDQVSREAVRIGKSQTPQLLAGPDIRERMADVFWK